MTATSAETISPAPAEDAYAHAMKLQVAGRLDLAEPIYRAILEAQPAHAGAHYCLGMLLVHQRQAAAGLPHLLAAVNAQPQIAEYWLGYLEALLLLGETAQAAEVLSLARQHGLAGSATEDFARRLESRSPWGASTATPTLKNEAPAPEAPAAADGAAIARLQSAAMALVEQGRCHEALPLAREMTERYPDCGMGWKILGAMLGATGKEREAFEAMQTSARLLPQDAEAHKNLAIIGNQLQRLDEAEGYVRRALQIDPKLALAHMILGHNLQLQGRYAEARSSLQKAIELQLAEAPLGPHPAQSILLFLLNNDPGVDAETLFAEHCKVGAHLARIGRIGVPAGTSSPGRGSRVRGSAGRRSGKRPAGGRPPVSRPARAARDRNPDRRIEVGFVSADLYNHSVAHFLEPMLSAWKDNKDLGLTAYYVNTLDDAVSRRLRGCFSRWHPVLGLSDIQLQERIVNDGIDILIDLSGHTASHRLATFARMPAPVQASWLGYPATTGVPAVDYYLADKHFLPPDEFERYFTEKLVYLPAAWTFQPAAKAPPVAPLPALTSEHFTFGSFNRIGKINEPTVQLWSQLLRAVPASRMLIAGVPLDIASRRLIPWFEAAGIARDRLSFHEFSSHEAHFALHHQVDLALESNPYSGCTTSNHALWMGVPSLSCVGSTPASRLSAANLGQLGLEDFIAVSPEDFVAKGVRWANDRAALATLRAGMRARWQSAPARNSNFVAAGMELALRRMWQRWCARLPAQSFEITAAEAASRAAR